MELIMSYKLADSPTVVLEQALILSGRQHTHWLCQLPDKLLLLGMKNT